MKVSFVIPTRNQAPFIRRCIDSCLAQELSDFEILVLDGKSTDGTQEILKSYGDRLWWRSEVDGGQSDAVNKGIALASGQLIAWINSDDYYASPAVVSTVLEHFEAGADFIYGDGLLVTPDGKTIRPYGVRALASAKALILSPASPLLQPAVFFSRQLFLDAGGLNLKNHWTLDQDLWLRMYPRALHPTFVPTALACWTLHSDAKSIRGMRAQIREIGEIKKRYAKLYALSFPEQVRLLIGSVSLYAYWMAVRLKLRRIS